MLCCENEKIKSEYMQLGDALKLAHASFLAPACAPSHDRKHNEFVELIRVVYYLS